MKSVLIVTAFAEEFNALKEYIKYPTQFKIDGLNYVEGEWGDKKIHLMCGGQGRAHIQKSLEIFLEKNMVHHVLLAGYCGGLRKDIKMGDVFLPCEFMLDPRIQKKPAIFVERIKILNSEIPSVEIVTVDEAVKTEADKKRLFEMTKCPIVDMEAFEVAEYLFFEEIPFYVLKVVLDDAQSEVGNVKDLKVNAEMVNPKLVNAVDKLLGLL